MAKRWTDLAVERLSVPAKETTIFDTGAVGLALKLTPAGARVWISWLRFPGAKYQSGRTLGYFPAMKVGEARTKAELWHSMVKGGTDPAEVERQERAKADAAREAAKVRAENTFSIYAETYIASRTTRQARKEGNDIRRDLITHLGKKPMDAITPRDIRKLMAKLRARSDHKADCAWGHLSLIFKRAVHEEVIPVSPMASLDRKLIFEGAKLGPRTRVLSDEEIFAYWRAAGRLPYPDGPFFRLLMLTGLRLNELAKAKWGELHAELRRVVREAAKADQPVDWARVPAEHKTLTIPRERFKSDAEHVAELSDDACRIIERLSRISGCEFLFSTTGKKAIWVNTKNRKRLDARMLRTLRALARRRGDDAKQVKLLPFVNHDLRRVVRSNLSALEVADHVAELVLGHAKRGLQRVYDQHRYGKQIRVALELWAGRLREIVSPPQPAEPLPDNVAPMQKAG